MSTQQRGTPAGHRGRLRPMTFAAAIGMTLVVYGHTPLLEAAHGQNVLTDWACAAYGFVYTFHMPLFFAISGFLYVYTNPPGRHRTYTELVRNKAVRLLLPYVALTSVVFPVKCLLSRFAIRPLEAGWESYLEGLLFPAKNPIAFFWFLPALFIVFLAAPGLLFCLRLRRKQLALPLQISVSAALVLTSVTGLWSVIPGPNVLGSLPDANVLGFLSAGRHIVFFWLGMWASHCFADKLSENAESGGKKYRFPCAAMLSAAAAALTLHVVLYLNFRYSYAGQTAGLHANGLGSQLAWFMMACLGTVATFCIAGCLARRSSRVLNTVGVYSYQIFLLSWFFQVPIQVGYIHFFPGAPVLLVASASLLLGIGGPLICVLVVLRYAPGIKPVVGL
jgi:fucose 4-O-acetylase-like acetyltransferase